MEANLESLLEEISKLSVGDLRHVTRALQKKVAEDAPGEHSSGVREPVDPKAPVLSGAEALKFPPEVV